MKSVRNRPNFQPAVPHPRTQLTRLVIQKSKCSRVQFNNTCSSVLIGPNIKNQVTAIARMAKLFGWLMFRSPDPNSMMKLEPIDSDPDSETNINNLMKGLAITYLRRQYSAFENYACSLEDLRGQVQTIGSQYWSKAVNKQRGSLDEEMNRSLNQTEVDAGKYLGPMTDSQRDKALVTWHAAFTLATQFFNDYTLPCLQALVSNLVNHSAPNWSIILEARVLMATEYANTVSLIGKIVVPRFVKGPARGGAPAAGRGGSTTKGRALPRLHMQLRIAHTQIIN